MILTAPKKRDTHLYARISPESKAWLDKMCKMHQCSLSHYLDHLIENVRIEMAYLEAKASEKLSDQ